jgi:transcriptional regulator with XRE-family HTH domain
VSLGSQLGEARRARGVTLEQAAAATRIRVRHLTALEEGHPAELPAPVYVRGYLRTYAGYLEIDPELLLDAYEATLDREGGSLAIRPLSTLTASPNVVLTAPVAGAIGLVLLTLAFGGYVYRQLDSVRAPASPPRAAATALPSPSPSPSTSPGPVVAAAPAPTPTPAPATLIVTVTDTVWIDVQVDGKPQFADAGKIMAAGSSLTFRGGKVKVTTGKAAATLVNVNGRNLGPMGSGVVTREYTSQT